MFGKQFRNKVGFILDSRYFFTMGSRYVLQLLFGEKVQFCNSTDATEKNNQEF